MNRLSKKSACVFLALLVLLGCTEASQAAGTEETGSALRDTAAYVCAAVPDPQVGSVGGEWAVLGLSRSGYEVPEDYFTDYYAEVQAYVAACGGVLSTRKYTEYSRVVLALTAIGEDPADVAGYDLLTPLGDFDKTVWQGINGPIWALIALDSGNYEVPLNDGAKTQATRELYVGEILSRQLDDGGFSLSGTDADAGITAMALTALSNYRNREDVSTAVTKALSCLSGLQESDGGYRSWGGPCSESTAQVIIALCTLKIGLDDPRFVKGGNTLLDHLLSFQRADGGFAHDQSSEQSDRMATEQALLALAAVRRAADGRSGVYELTDRMETGQKTGAPWLQSAANRSMIFYYRKNKMSWGKTP